MGVVGNFFLFICLYIGSDYMNIIIIQFVMLVRFVHLYLQSVHLRVYVCKRAWRCF